MRIELLQKRSEIILNQVNNYNFAGNIIPHSWYRSILLEKGRPDMTAITILAEICYWYRWQYIEDSQTGEILSKKAKFQADLLQRNIDSLQQKFGFSKRGITDALTRLEKAKLVFRELRTVKTKHGNYGNVLFLAPRMKNIVKLDSCIPLTQKTAQGYVKNDDGKGNQGFPDPSRKKQHKLTQKPTQAYAENCVTYTKITTKTSTKNKAAKQNLDSSQDGIALDQQNFVEPAAANFLNSENEVAEKSVSQSNIPNTQISVAEMPMGTDNHQTQSGTHMGKVESQIGTQLTANQKAYVAKMAERFARNNTGLKPEMLEAEILNPHAFKMCGKDFMYKVNAIAKQLAQGIWTPCRHTSQKPSNAPVCNAAISAQRYRDSKQGKIDSIKKSIVSIQSTFTDRMAQFRDASFFTVQRKQLARYEQQLRELGVVTADSIDLPVESAAVSQQHVITGAHHV